MRFLPLLVLACCGFSRLSAQTAFIGGTVVRGVPEDTVTLSDMLSPVYQSAVAEGRLSAQNTFALRLNASEGFYKLSIGNEYTYLYLTPGDSLWLTVDCKNFDKKLKYAGRGAERNNLVAQFYGKYRFGEINHKDSQKASNLDITLYTNFVFRRIREEQEFVEAYCRKHPSCGNSFLRLFLEDIRYYWALQAVRYPKQFEQKNGKLPDIDAHKAEYNAIRQNPVRLTEIDSKSPNFYLSYSDYFRQIAIGCLLAQRKYESGEGPVKIYEQDYIWQFLRDSVPAPINSYILAKYTSYVLNSHGADSLSQALMAKFDTYFPQSPYIMQLRADYEKLKPIPLENFRAYRAPGTSRPVNYMLVNAGDIMPEIRFTKAESPTDTLTLSSLRGKAVYIDIWATWCGPCIGQFPYSKSLHEKLKRENVEFVYVVTDNDRIAWKRLVKSQNVEGLHLRQIGNGWESEFMNRFNVQGIPHYIILDKQGKIVATDAPRPSERKTYRMLKKLARG